MVNPSLMASLLKMPNVKKMEIAVDTAEAAERLEELIEFSCAGDKVSISIDGIARVMLVPLVSMEEFYRLTDPAEPESPEGVSGDPA